MISTELVQGMDKIMETLGNTGIQGVSKKS